MFCSRKVATVCRRWLSSSGRKGAPPPLTEEALEDNLASPSVKLVDFVKSIDGDFIILGAGGKMGPSLSLLLKRATQMARVRKRIIAVSKFSQEGIRERLRSAGVHTISANLMNAAELGRLPKADLVVNLAAQKFGTAGGEHTTWALNSLLPARIAETFRDSRILHFSSGNVYPLVSRRTAGSREEDPPAPVGEYAQSRLAGERILEHFSRKYGIPMIILRLNYAVELRYGVLHDVARAVMRKQPVDLRMGYVNVIWQADANDAAVRSLRFASSPPAILNLTGPEKVSIRWLAKEFGKLFGVRPIFRNSERSTALLSDASAAMRSLGTPRVKLSQMIVWVGEWLRSGGTSLNKPTHFQERKGRF